MSKPGIWKDIMGTDLWIKNKLVIDPQRNIYGKNVTAETIFTDNLCNINSNDMIITGNIIPCGNWNLHDSNLLNVLNLTVDKILSDEDNIPLEYGNLNSTNVSDLSVVVGYNNELIGSSVIMGINNNADFSSISLGYDLTAVEGSVAMGQNMNAALSSVALGTTNFVSYGQSVSMGYYNGSVVRSQAIGGEGFAWGYSISIGSYANAGQVMSNPFDNFINHSIAIGYSATSDYSSISIGENADTSICYHGISIGRNSSAGEEVYCPISIGNNAYSRRDRCIAIGYSAYSESMNSIAIGYESSVLASEGVVIGKNASASGENAVAIGASVESAYDNWNSVTIGSYSSTYGDSGVNLGYNSNMYGIAGIVIGRNSSVTDYGISIGYNADADNQDYGLAIGYESYSGGRRSIAIGQNASSTYWNTIAIGRNSYAHGSQAIAIGRNSGANGWRGVAVGAYTKSQDDKAIAIGNYAQANHYNSIVLGVNGTSQASDRLHLSFPTSPLVPQSLYGSTLCLSIFVNGQELQIPVKN